jgi:RNA polymerase sigma-70 factor (ECF subfamily)
MDEPGDLVLERLLVLQGQTGDPRALEALIERYGPRLRYFLRRILGAAGDPEDILQEVWIDVFRKLHLLRSTASFRSWLYRIARDRAFGELRRRGKLPESIDSIAIEPEAAPEPEFTAEDAARIHAGLELIEPDQREVLLMRFLEDMSYEEMAEATDCPVGTVRSRLHNAKRALRLAIERMEREERRRAEEGALEAGNPDPRRK